jgi:hypothetical protein
MFFFGCSRLVSVCSSDTSLHHPPQMIFSVYASSDVSITATSILTRQEPLTRLFWSSLQCQSLAFQVPRCRVFTRILPVSNIQFTSRPCPSYSTIAIAFKPPGATIVTPPFVAVLSVQVLCQCGFRSASTNRFIKPASRFVL